MRHNWFIWWLRGVVRRWWYRHVYLTSPGWRETRARIFKRDGYRCTKCGGRRGLQVHHLTYARVGHEWDSDLVTRCEKCHALEHPEKHGKKGVTDVWSGLVAALLLVGLLLLFALTFRR